MAGKKMTRAKRKAPKKGVAGKNTGGKTRAAIKSKKRAGSSVKQIAKAGMRHPSTIQSISSGEIKNPPRNLAGKIRKAKTTKRKSAHRKRR